MFSSLATGETHVTEANFASWKKVKVFEPRQKRSCFPGELCLGNIYCRVQPQKKQGGETMISQRFLV